MATFGRDDDLRGARFAGVDLTGATFAESDLSAVVMRGVEVRGADIDAPWLPDGGGTLVVNGVDVVPFVEAQLDLRFPGRGQRRATDPDGLRAAWDVLQATWSATCDRVAGMPDGTVDISVDGEWSFAQTLRHLIMATDTWLGRAIMQLDEPFHPVGQPDAGTASDGTFTAAFDGGTPAYDVVLRVRAERVAMVREFIAAVTAEQLTEERRNPHDPQYPETVLSCLHTILEEEWEHHRYAVRDLDRIKEDETPAPPGR